MDNENGGSNVNYIYGDMLTERAKAFTGLESGSIWFVCFLPLLGLFLENFAVSKWAGAFLWVSVIILMPVCCAADLRRIKKLETDGRSIKKLEKSVLLAPLYVYRREKYCMRETYKAIMLVVFSMAAVIMNGFTQGLSVHEGSVPVLLRNTYVQNLDNFSGSSQNVIGEQLEEYLGEDAEWDCKKSGDVYTAVCSGVHNGKETEISFSVEHDGFTYIGCKVESISIDGEKLKDNEYSDALTEIFIPEAAEESSSEDESE
ncbi:MAG: hypothetical protein J5994_03800 [Ruminococcus sp.]|nr:hypothetical protein [Ruminococcus sp.]